ncbi:MAG: PulJ/GspJ family protein [Armatimonadota bacterium]
MRPDRRRPTEHGYTLMEVAVVVAPMALIALSLFAAFRFTVLFSQRIGTGVEALQQARLAMSRVSAELREADATPGAIVIFSRDAGDAQDGVGFFSARLERAGRPFDNDDNGAPRWQRAVYYLHDHARGELRRFTGERATLRLPAPTSGGAVLARHIRRLRLAREGDLVTITLMVAKPTGEAVLETAVRPRN